MYLHKLHGGSVSTNHSHSGRLEFFLFFRQLYIYETILLFHNYLPFRKGYTLYFNNLDSPSHKNSLYQYCVWDFLNFLIVNQRGNFSSNFRHYYIYIKEIYFLLINSEIKGYSIPLIYLSVLSSFNFSILLNCFLVSRCLDQGRHSASLIY